MPNPPPPALILRRNPPLAVGLWSGWLAAGAALAIAAGLALGGLPGLRPPDAAPAGIYASSAGGPQAFRLADGATVTLNRSSRFDISFAGGRSEARLLSGEAAIAPPAGAATFVLSAGKARVRADGEFDVSRDGDRVVVTALSGSVEVSAPGAAPARLTQGMRARVSPGQAIIVENGVNLAATTAWRSGAPARADATLAQAGAGANR